MISLNFIMKKGSGLIYAVISLTVLYFYLKGHAFPAFNPSYLLFLPCPDTLKYLFFATVAFSAADIGAYPLSLSKKISDYPAPIRFCLSTGAGFIVISSAILGLFALRSANILSFSALLILPFLVRAAALISGAPKIQGGGAPCEDDSTYAARLTRNLPTFALLKNIFTPAIAEIKKSMFSGVRNAAITVALISALAFAAVFSTLPQTSWDALAYQLEIPKQYISEGRLFFISDIHFWGHPQLVNMIYSIFIMFGMDTLSSTFHSYFILLTVCLILSFPLGRSMGIFTPPFARMTAALLYAAHPQVLLLSSYAYVDLPLTFYFTAAVFLLSETEYLAAAAFAGGAMSVKYTGLVMGLACAVSSLVSIGSERARSSNKENCTECALNSRPADGVNEKSGAQSSTEKKCTECALNSRPADGVNGEIFAKMKRALVISAIAALVFSPYMMKNYHFTSNPFYPYMADFVPWEKTEYKYLDLYQTMLDAVGMDSAGAQKSIFGMATYPFVSALWSRFRGNTFYDGVMGVTFLLLIPFFAAGLARPIRSCDDEKKRSAAGFFLIFLIYYVFVLKAQSTRFFLPITPVFFMVSASGLAWYAGYIFPAGEKRLKNAAAVAGIIFILANASPVLNEFAKLDPRGYLSGREDKRTYLSRTMDMWDCVERYNQALAASSEKFYLIPVYETRTYYIAGKYSWRDLFEPSAVETEVTLPDDNTDNFAHKTAEDVLASLKKLGATHILLGDAQKRVLLRNIGAARRQDIMLKFLNERTDILLSKRNYTLYKIRY